MAVPPSFPKFAPDVRLLFAARIVRMFAFGFLSVVLALYLTERGFDETAVGLLLSVTLLGDVALSFVMSLTADRFGRRTMLVTGAVLIIFAGVALALFDTPFLIFLAVLVGTMSPTGNEVGPFVAIEQAALAQLTPGAKRTDVFAWYNLIGSFATAFGAFAAGNLAQLLQLTGYPPLESYRTVVAGYAVIGGLLFLIFTRLSPQVEVLERKPETIPARLGLHRSRGIVFKLAGLFMLDAFAGGLVLQSVMAYWFDARFGVSAAMLGAIFFAANILAGLSALVAGRLAQRFGLVNTMVWTHIPSNVLLMLVPLMPTLPLAVVLLLIRFSISQMDVPTRQSYIMAVVDPDERSAAAGVTSIARTASSAIAPTLTGILFQFSLFSAPFFIAGVLKIIYDLLLYQSFITVKPPEESLK